MEGAWAEVALGAQPEISALEEAEGLVLLTPLVPQMRERRLRGQAQSPAPKSRARAARL